jgi:hypothetical protein
MNRPDIGTVKNGGAPHGGHATCTGTHPVPAVGPSATVDNRGGPGLHGKEKAGLWNETEIQNGCMHQKDTEKR